MLCQINLLKPILFLADLWFTKWKGLKDNFVKFKKSSEPAHADTYKNYKNWPWAEQLMFLDDCFSSRRVPKYIPKPREEIHEPSKQQTPQNFELNIPDENTTNSESSIEHSNKLGQQEEQEAIDEDLENHEVPTYDGVEQFFLSYAQSFKKLPNRMQIMLKLDIATLFSRYELQADGVTPELIDSIPRIVPHPVKREFDLINTIDD